MIGSRGTRRWIRHWALIVAAAPLAMLTGCPSDQSAAAPGKAPVTVTAPQLGVQQAQAGKTSSMQMQAQLTDGPAPSAKTQTLIDRAEASYRSGVTNYRANRLDAARMDFDTAVDTLLSSGMDVKSDAALAEEVEHLLDAVNSLEMVALKQGNGFSPKLEEAPLEDVGDLTFAPNPELTARLKAELQTKSDLPLIINDQTAGYIGAFANSTAFRAHMVHSLERAGKYKAIIQKALADQGLPQDLFYLAVAESGFQPQAVNPRSGAGGMWQFMPTGAYGLARNGYVDERFDPEKSSVAYAKYMKTVYHQLGDWYLAMAGYDWGPGYVQRAVMKTGYADFWELYRRGVLPKETKEYVPKILAAIIMAKNPARYGLDKVVPEPAIVYDTVTVDYALDLRLVADVTDASLQEIAGLNPSLLRMTTPSTFSFDLHIPAGTHTLFADRLKEIPEDKRASWRFHVVHVGESLEAVAASLHAHASEIAEVNGLKTGEALEAGDELIVPVTVTYAVARPQVYTVRRGDTLVAVADRFNISAANLRAWNPKVRKAFRLGLKLRVSEPVRLGPSFASRRVAAYGRRGPKYVAFARSRGSSRSSLRGAKLGASRRAKGDGGKHSKGSGYASAKHSTRSSRASAAHGANAHARALPGKKRKGSR